MYGARKNVLIGTTVLLFALLLVVPGCGKKGAEKQHPSLKKVKPDVQRLVDRIDELADSMEKIAVKLGDDIADHDVPRSDVPDKLRTFADENPHLLGVGVAYAPQSVQEPNLYAPYLKRDEAGNWELAQIEEQYAYTKLQHDWYNLPMNKGRPVWIEPHVGEISGEYLVEVASPFPLSPEEEVELQGVSIVSFPIEELRPYVDTEGMLGEDGYAFLLSSDGRFLAHPNPNVMFADKTFATTKEAMQDSTLKVAMRTAAMGVEKVTTYKDGDGIEWTYYMTPVSDTGWIFVAVYRFDQV